MRFSLAKIFGTLALLSPVAALAADGSGTAAASFNPVMLLLATLIVVLGAAVALLANVFQQLVFVYRDKMRKERQTGVIKTLLVLLLAGFGFAAHAAGTKEAVTDATEQVAAVSPYIAGIDRFDFYCIISVMGFELLLIAVFLILIRSMVRTLRNVPEKAPLMQRILSRNLLDFFNRSVAVEKEEGILLDHDYDGIRELDNSLPPWWKYGFYLTIFVAVVYIWHYHFGGGPNQVEEYTAAVEQAEAEKAEYLAKHATVVDENNLAAVTDPAELGKVQTIFQNTCAACHAKDGGGMVGPNLTDNFWLHGGSLKDVYKSIKYGWSDKGMPSWETSLSPTQVIAMASYIKTLKGTHPAAPKAAQGEPYVEKVENNKTTDSTAAKKPLLAMAGK